MGYVKRLVHYKQWADNLFWSAIVDVPEPDLVAPRPIIFGNLIRTLNHAYLMDFVWKCHLLQQPHGLTTRNPPTHPSIEALASYQRDIDAWYMAYVDSIAEHELYGNVEFTYIGGGTGTMSRLDIILHVVNHTTYHRGHAADILYGIGISPPTTDYTVFVSQYHCHLA